MDSWNENQFNTTTTFYYTLKQTFNNPQITQQVPQQKNIQKNYIPLMFQKEMATGGCLDV